MDRRDLLGGLIHEYNISAAACRSSFCTPRLAGDTTVISPDS
jgi:hypothetical protein